MQLRLCAMTCVALAGGCGTKSTDAVPGPSDSSTGATADTDTPASMLPDGSATSAGDAAASAQAAREFVRRSFDANAAKVVQASCGGDKLRLTLDGVLFDFDKDNLEPGGDDILAQVKKASVDPYPSAHIVVEGHTDDVGTDAHNDDLSLRRAKTVASWLQAHGVEASRLQTKGYGKRWPRVPNTTDDNRAKNRRVELIVLDQTAAKSCAQPHVPVTGPGEAQEGPGRPPEHDDGAGTGRSGSGIAVPIPETTPLTPVAFSYHYNDNIPDHHYTCFSFDPAWLPPNAPPMGLLKKDYRVQEGQFVDHCPTENVIASCDKRSFVPEMEWYYTGMTEAELGLRKQICGGKWVRNGAPAAVAKMPPDTGTYALVCDVRQTEHRCVEYRSDADATEIATAKYACKPDQQPARCPVEGVLARCEARGVINFYYVAADSGPGLRQYCEGILHGAWSQP
jgi:outer membrane protein OmpA-like peptidoglycan-associated protein